MRRMRWMMSALLTLLAAVPNVAWSAYAAFDDLQVQTPAWLQLGGGGSGPEGVIYRLSRQAPGMARLELRNASAADWALGLRLPGFQRDGAALRVALPAHGQLELLVPISHLDQGLYRLRLGCVVGDGDPANVPAPSLGTPAYGVSVAGITAGFRAEALGYTISVRDGVADVHVRNFSADTIHGDFILAGWQDPARQRNPRLHLLPGTTSEVLIPLERIDGAVAHAVLEVWNLRIGVDHGPLLVSQPIHADHLLDEEGWQRIAVLGFAETSAGFNPRVVSWRTDVADPTRVVLRNRSPNVIGAHVRVQIGTQLAELPLTLTAMGESTLTLPFTPAPGQRPFVAFDQVVIDQRALAPAAAVVHAAVPEQALSVTPRQPDSRFNPLTVVYVLERGSAGHARLHIINRSAIAVFADCAIAGYQDPVTRNPRLHLPAGQAVTLALPVTRSDARLALARVLVWNVRLGEDSGETLVAAP